MGHEEDGIWSIRNLLEEIEEVRALLVTCWASLSDGEIRRQIREVVRSSSSDEEIRRLVHELGCPHELAITSRPARDCDGCESREFAGETGSMIRRDGAVVTVTLCRSHGGTILI